MPDKPKQEEPVKIDKEKLLAEAENKKKLVQSGEVIQK